MNWNAAAVSLQRERPWWESNGGCPRIHALGSIFRPARFCLHGTTRLKLLALMLLLLFCCAIPLKNKVRVGPATRKHELTWNCTSEPQGAEESPSAPMRFRWTRASAGSSP